MRAKGLVCLKKGVRKLGSIWMDQQHLTGNTEVSPTLAELLNEGRWF